MEKWEKNTQFGHFSETCTSTIELVPVQLNLYRYNFVTGHFWPSCTGTS